MSKLKIPLISLAFLLAITGQAWAICAGTPFNPATDVCWDCMFPIKIGGVTTYPNTSGSPDPPDSANTSWCVCPAPPPIHYRYGIPIAFWEPRALVETVKEPFCSPTLGESMAGSWASSAGYTRGFGSGAGSDHSQGGQTDVYTFAHAHYIKFPIWAVMGLLTDLACTTQGGFDVMFMSEYNFAWSNDALAAIENPDAKLFANYASQTACAADGAAANTWLPLNELYWCMGSWGSAFPLTGHITEESDTQANVGLAARVNFLLSRLGMVMDCGVYMCGCVYTPNWVKWNYRFHVAKPVRDSMCHPIGRSSLIWGAMKNPPYSGNNFLWVTFRKRTCCAF
ncbi:MAG: TraU family protein [Candidatus Nitrospinota bacterium M3_3B_026]